MLSEFKSYNYPKERGEEKKKGGRNTMFFSVIRLESLK